MKQIKILLVDANPTGRLGAVLEQALASSFDLHVLSWTDNGGQETTCSNDVATSVQTCRPSVIFVVLPSTHLGNSGKFFEFLAQTGQDIPTIVVTEEAQPERVFRLLKLGAVDFVTPPIRTIDVLPRVWRLVDQNANEDKLTRNLKVTIGLGEIVGKDPAFVSEINKIPVVAKCDVSVLIQGETGTGKELCARAIHYLSPRRRKVFMPVNCGAIPTELIENELFGHDRGAFTGALTSQAGLIQEAEGGTLFLDEIDCLPLTAQVKLLRFFEEKEYRRLGSAKMRKADVRILAATNAELEELVEKGRFRQDLYYRLNIIPLLLPPLRERREDIPLLAGTFLARFAAKFGKQVSGFSPDAMKVLLCHEWPGNVRELQHLVERAVVFSEKPILESTDLAVPRVRTVPCGEAFQTAKARVIAQFEQKYIERLLAAHDWNITQAARAAQKNRRAFWELMRKHQIKNRHGNLRKL